MCNLLGLSMVFCVISASLAQDEDHERKVFTIDYKNRATYLNQHWTDPYLALRPKSNFEGHPSRTCWHRGGICVPRNLCTMQFESLIQGCASDSKVCCKDYSRTVLKDFQHLGLYKLVAREGIRDLEQEGPEDLYEKSLKNSYIVQTFAETLNDDA